VLNQTYQDFEIILLDDASTDGSLDILKSYEANPKVSKLLINEKNTGNPFQQWLKGVQEAKGEYVWIAESDDWAKENFLSTMVSNLDQDKTLAMAFCRPIYVYPDGSDSYTGINNSRKWDGYEFIINRLASGCYIKNASGVLFRTKLFLSHVANDILKLTRSGDWLAWIGLASVGNVYESSERLTFFRRPAFPKDLIRLNNQILTNEYHFVLKNLLKKVRIKGKNRLTLYYKISKGINRLKIKKVISLLIRFPKLIVFVILSSLKDRF